MNIFLFKSLKNYCKKCRINYEEKCMFCPREFIFEGLNIASREETLDEIIFNNKSLSRFGDGEFKIIFGLGIGFHRSSELLKKKLINVLNCSMNNLLIGINLPYHEFELNSRPDPLRDYWKNYINITLRLFLNILYCIKIKKNLIFLITLKN